jgi:D-alanine-D-alanine ligase-like ATP-grasp enzyme
MATLPIDIKASLSFLAAGNIHFAGHCVVVQLPEALSFNQSISLEAGMTKALVHFQVDQPLTSALIGLGRQEPSNSAGQVARFALMVQYLAGLDPTDVLGWREYPSDKSLAVFTCPDRPTGRAAALLALNILSDGSEVECARAAAMLIEAEKPWTLPLAKVARSRNIPVTVVAAERPFLALGQGVKRRLFWRNFTPNTSHVATILSTRKDLTARLLREAGLPAPRNVVVRDAHTAVRVAQELGFPVVVKPVTADFGWGVSTGNQSEEQVRAAFTLAAQHGAVLVEEQIPGEHHRLLVMHGRCIAISRRLPARVIGDGISTILQLVELANRTRTEQLTSAGVKIKLDDVALGLLQHQALSPYSVPEPGQVILLRGNANQSSGGTVEMMTDRAHPDVVRLAIQAAALLGIDVAGIDYLTTDISCSPGQTQGAICEVNVTPGFVNQGDSNELLGTHIAPVFSDGDDGRIATICLVWPSDGHGPLADALTALLDTTVARSDDVRFWQETERAALPRRTAATLSDPLAAAALIACTPQELKATGLGLDRCTLAVLASSADKDIAAALLRIAANAVIPASIVDQLGADPHLARLLGRVWIVSDGASCCADYCAGYVRRVSLNSIAVYPRIGAPWSISNVPATKEAEIVVAAGAALGVPMTRVSEILRLYAFRDRSHNLKESTDAPIAL